MSYQSDVIITNVKVYLVNVEAIRHRKGNQTKKYDFSWATESVIANPLSGYAEYYKKRSSWFGMMGEVFIEVETNKGIVGFGMTTGGAATAAIIKQHFVALIIGQSPYHIEKIWDVLFRASLPYGRKGVAVMALSAIDLALWDIVSKLREEPLYVSLGGAVRNVIPVYVTGNDFSETLEAGFIGQKLAMPYGPASGIEGMRKNVELVSEARKQLGDHLEIMLDCYMGWDVEYTVRMAELLRPYRIRWIEEALMPDDYSGYASINQSIHSTAIATGEHEYTRYGFQQLLDMKGATIIQPDIYWCGGLTEAKKICALASSRNISVIPHAGCTQPWTQHLLFAEPSMIMAEYFYGAGLDHPFFAGIQVPQSGKLVLPDCIGTGLKWQIDAKQYLSEVN